MGGGGHVEAEGVLAGFEEGGGEGEGEGVVLGGADRGAVGGGVVAGVDGGADFCAVDFGLHDGSAAAAGEGDGEVGVSGGRGGEVEVYVPVADFGLGEVPIFGFLALADGVGEVRGDFFNPLNIAGLVAEFKFTGHGIGFSDLPEKVIVVGSFPIDRAEVEGGESLEMVMLSFSSSSTIAPSRAQA